MITSMPGRAWRISSCSSSRWGAAEAKGVGERFEVHYTPKHGSWLNRAEIEFSILGRQCLSRRIADAESLHREVAAWEAIRNGSISTVHWQFTTQDARIKLIKLYPSIE